MTRDRIPIPSETLRWRESVKTTRSYSKTVATISYLLRMMGPCRWCALNFTKRVKRNGAIESDCCSSGTEYGTAFIWDDMGKGAEDFPVLVYALLFYSFHGRLFLIGHKLGRSLQLPASPVTVQNQFINEDMDIWQSDLAGGFVLIWLWPVQGRYMQLLCDLPVHIILACINKERHEW